MKKAFNKLKADVKGSSEYNKTVEGGIPSRRHFKIFFFFFFFFSILVRGPVHSYTHIYTMKKAFNKLKADVKGSSEYNKQLKEGFHHEDSVKELIAYLAEVMKYVCMYVCMDVDVDVVDGVDVCLLLVLFV